MAAQYIDDVCRQYGIRKKELLFFLDETKVPYKKTWRGETIDGVDTDRLASDFGVWREKALERKRARKAEQERLEAEARQAVIDKQQALANMLITSGFTFDGYRVARYSGYISGDDVIQVDRGTSWLFGNTTNTGEELSKALVTLRRNALAELKEAAYALGCNAVIGVDFDYITLDPQTANVQGGTTYLPYVFCVTANGNAVVIEKTD